MSERENCRCNPLFTILRAHGKYLDEEFLQTPVTQTEGTLNSQSLTVKTIRHPATDLPVSPANILTMKSKVVVAPPRNFSRPNLYCREKWWRVQYIANEFWSRWRKQLHSMEQASSSNNELVQ